MAIRSSRCWLGGAPKSGDDPSGGVWGSSTTDSPGPGQPGQTDDFGSIIEANFGAKVGTVGSDDSFSSIGGRYQANDPAPPTVNASVGKPFTAQDRDDIRHLSSRLRGLGRILSQQPNKEDQALGEMLKDQSFKVTDLLTGP